MTVRETEWLSVTLDTIVPVVGGCRQPRFTSRLRVACIDQTGQSSIEVTPAPGRAEVGGTPQMRGLKTVSVTQRNGQGPDSSLKMDWMFV